MKRPWPHTKKRLKSNLIYFGLIITSPLYYHYKIGWMNQLVGWIEPLREDLKTGIFLKTTRKWKILEELHIIKTFL